MLKIDADFFNVLKFQSEVVTELPPGAVVLWKSANWRYEIYKIGENILSMESHPEFTEAFLERHIVKRLYDTLIINEEYKNEIIADLNDPKTPVLKHQLLKCCKQFLKG